MRRATDFRQQGVTLIEMVVAIVVTGVVLSLAGMFGRWQIQSYMDVSSRVALADAGDTALRRIARELQAALPNSARVTVSGANKLLEFVPIRDAGRYRAEKDSSGAGNAMDVDSAAAIEVDVFGPAVNLGIGDWLVVYNLGLEGDYSAYEDPGSGKSSRRAVSLGASGGSSIKFTPKQGGASLFASPQHRFHIVAAPVTFECVPNSANPDQGVIRRRWGYGFKTTQPVTEADFGINKPSSLLVSGVADCSIVYTPAVLQRNGLIVLRLTLANADGSERIELLHQVEVLNTP